MPDDIKQQKPAEETKQEERETTPEGLQPEQKPAEELPEGTKERTKQQFDKLKENNKALKEELEQYKNAPSVLERFTKPKEQESLPQPPVQQPVQNFAPQQGNQDLVGADGTISDVGELNRRLRLAEEARREAELAKNQIAEYQLTQQARELHRAFPEVDPNSPTFNPEAYDLVSKELLTQLVNNGSQDPIAAASKMSKYFREKPKQEAEQQQAVEQLQQATSSPQAGNYADLDEQELAVQSRTDDDAMYERMRRAGI